MYPQRSVMTCGLATALEPPHFNPRTRVGCDDASVKGKPRDLMFQSTHPRGVRPSWPLIVPTGGKCFNPRTRVGCDGHRQDLHLRGQVSIHAPAWGATPGRAPDGAVEVRFNPRTRVGCDRSACANGRQDALVSIHAPAWGATERQTVICGRYWFQSTHPRGVRPHGRGSVITGGKFQSTHPRGVRRLSLTHWPPDDKCFNPRTRVGCDLRGMTASGWVLVFQSTHPRGVRLPPSSHTGTLWSFNPRTRVGCDGLRMGVASEAGKFQSTHPRGVRRTRHAGQW